MADRTLEIQAAFVAALKAHAGVSALVGARVYDRIPEAAAVPNISIGSVSGDPFDAVGLRGQRNIFDVHAWSEKPGAVECRQIMAQINDALHWADLTLSAGTAVRCNVISKRDTADPDGVTHHGTVTFEIITDG